MFQFPARRPEHRRVPKLEKLFSQVIVLLPQSLRYRRPLPLKPSQKIDIVSFSKG